MILSFKKTVKREGKQVPTEFKEKILDGIKVHTIREDTKNRWREGMNIHFATGVRTKAYECFKERECTNVQRIQILHAKGMATVRIDGSYFGQIWHHGLDDIYEYSNCLLALAHNDGFESLEDFFMWFDKSFEGRIIHWTDLKYK